MQDLGLVPLDQVSIRIGLARDDLRSHQMPAVGEGGVRVQQLERGHRMTF